MSKRKKKNRNLGPRRKRMRRPARLMAAVTWLAGYGGNAVRGYARWFGVDLICAIPSCGCSGCRRPGVRGAAATDDRRSGDTAGKATRREARREDTAGRDRMARRLAARVDSDRARGRRRARRSSVGEVAPVEGDHERAFHGDWNYVTRPRPEVQ
jgi:hypothetical protein